MQEFRCYKLAVSFYRLVEKVKLEPHLYLQLVRAAASVVCNLSEGDGRKTLPDRQRFFVIAFGSLRECQSVLDLGNVSDPIIVDKADHLAASIYKLCRYDGRK